jgi:hypothetical protein
VQEEAKPIAYRHLAIDEVRISCSYKSRVVISRINESRRSEQGRVAQDPEESENRGSAFGVSENKEKLHHGSAIREFPKVTRQLGAPEDSGVQVALYQGIGTSVLGVWKFSALISRVAISRAENPRQA